MIELFKGQQNKSQYLDKKLGLSREEYTKKLEDSSTVYVGNLSIYTKEENIYELFSKCGVIKDI